MGVLLQSVHKFQFQYMFLLVLLPLVRVVLTMNRDLSPWPRLNVLKALVLSPCVTEVFPIAMVFLPIVKVFLVQEIDDFPQDRAYLVLRTKVLPLVKVVLLEKKLVVHSPPESLFDFFPGLEDLALVSGLLSI